MVGTDRGASLGRRIGALGLTVVLLVGTLVVGWLVWSVFEWRHGRTPSYRLLGLRVVRRSDARPIGLGRSLLRSGICCPLLVVPTVVIGGVIGLCFALGASPPDGLLRQPRTRTVGLPHRHQGARRAVPSRAAPRCAMPAHRTRRRAGGPTVLGAAADERARARLKPTSASASTLTCGRDPTCSTAGHGPLPSAHNMLVLTNMSGR